MLRRPTWLKSTAAQAWHWPPVAAAWKWLAQATQSRWWQTWLGPALALGWLGVALHLALRRHATFHTHLFDLGYYTHVLWHTAHGRWFFNTLRGTNFLQDHFSPLLAALAPLMWVAPDARPLIVVQSVVLAASILPAYAILRAQHARLAPWLVAAYCFNFLVHRTALLEFHEIMLAALPLALAFWGLYLNRRWLVVASIGLALLVREDIGLYVAVLGLYAVCARAGARRFGLAVMAAGIAWTALVPTVLMPALGLGVLYHLWKVIPAGGAAEQASLPSVAMRLFTGLLTWPKLRAVGQLMLAAGGLPLLGAGEQLLWAVPMIFLLLLPFSDVGGLRDWYVAPLLPMLWCGMALSLARMSEKRARLWLAGLMLGTAVTFLAWSPFPGGGDYRPDDYRFTLHHAIGHAVLSRIPADVPVAAQSALAPHVAGRYRIDMFPWYDSAIKGRMIVVDEYSASPYPFSSEELALAVKNLKLEPTMALLWEQDGYHLFQTDTDWTVGAPPPRVWSDQLALSKLELAQTDAEGAYQPDPAALISGRTLRVAFYWTALSELRANYSISVRLTAPDGTILAQDDAWPGQGLLGTLELAASQTARDYHYIPLPEQLPADVALSVIVYDSATQTRLAPAEGYVLSTFATLAQAP